MPAPTPTPPTNPGGQPPPKPPDSTSTPPTYVAGSWQCTIDGIDYSGTIDTSFTRHDSSISTSHPDTAIFCTGTSFDKRANIHFQLSFNRQRQPTQYPFSTAVGGAVLNFDTCSDNILEGFVNSSDVQFYIDSVSSTKLQGHFSGALTSYNANGGTPGHIVTNGKFVTGWQGGNHDPNSFSYMKDGSLNLDSFDPDLVTGYFNSARLISNTLVLDGTPNNWGGLSRFSLLIHTGGTIQPGTYHSENGDAGLRLSISESDLGDYVDDSAGSLTVTITSVSGNVVTGNFTGQFRSSGSFAVRIKNYQPEADSANKWSFGAYQTGYPVNFYHIYGGNILQASEGNSGGRYSLTVKGESDLGASVFKIVISSPNPIQSGTYTSNQPNIQPNSVDSFYFISPEKIWNGNDTYYSIAPSPMFVVIDSIDEHHVQGEIKGTISEIMNVGSIFSFEVQSGRFSASF